MYMLVLNGVTAGAVSRLLSLFLPLIFLTTVLPGAGLAADVVLSWDPSTDDAVAGYRVYYQAGSPVIPFHGTEAREGNAPVDGGSATTAALTGLNPDQSYYFAVTAYSSTGEESSYSNIVEVKESVAPVIGIASSAVGTPAQGVVSISARAFDNVGVSRVRFYIDDEPAAEWKSPPYLFSWDTSPLAAGAYTVSARAFDAAGNEASSNSITFTVAGDTVPPRVILAAPSGLGQASGVVGITVSARDDVRVAKLELFIDGSLVLGGNQTPVTYNWDTSAWQNGSHTLNAKAYDAAGNTASATMTVVVENVIEPSAAAKLPVADIGTGEVTAAKVQVLDGGSEEVAAAKTAGALSLKSISWTEAEPAPELASPVHAGSAGWRGGWLHRWSWLMRPPVMIRGSAVRMKDGE